MTIEHPIEDEVTQLARRVEKARGRLAWQFDPALTEALSEDELHAERELAERIREQERGQRWKEVQALSAAADRARQTTEAIEKADMRDLLVARKAIAAQRRESSPHARLASLYRHRSWSLRALAGVVGAGMLWSAVNVQHNIAPGGPSDPLFWFSYLLEGMISVCLIIIMIGTNKVSEWGVVDNRGQVALAELALLGLTVCLNTYPYLRGGEWYEVAVHAIAPVMIGVALLIHDAASARYGLAIARATEQVKDMPDPAERIRRQLPSIANYARSMAAQAALDEEVAPVAAEPQVVVVPVEDVEPEVVEVEEIAGPPAPRKRNGVPGPVEAQARNGVQVTDEVPVQQIAPAPKPAPAAKVAPAASAAAAGNVVPAGNPAANGDAVRKAEPVEQAATEKRRTAIDPARIAAALNGDLPAPTKTNGRPVAAEKRVAQAEAEPRPAARVNAKPAAKPAAPVKAAAPAKPARKAEAPAPVEAAPAAERKAPAKAAVAEKPSTPEPDPLYDTGQFRVADILEQELAELQAERRKARTSKQRTATR
ncbi:hypothetical protein [Nocardia sp. NPDC048505]|uniref:hypothetical protein n=1 Tax=unclassified Nocardia TaxID=2637762 RepID=UPI0033E57265